jgi:hypothetical protein
VNESAAITSFLSAPTGGEIQFFSSLYKGLVDCRSATNRDIRTGENLPTEEHDSWVGALGYFALLDLIGTCLTREGLNQELGHSDTSVRYSSRKLQKLKGVSTKPAAAQKTRSMVDRYAKFATEHLAAAASRIESVPKENVIELSRFCHGAAK